MSERDKNSSDEQIYPDDKKSDYLLYPNIEELEYHLSHGASPLAGIEFPDVKQLQENVVRPLILQRIEQSAPADVPAPLRQFMENSFLYRFNGRALRNFEAHSERLEKNPPELSSSVYYDMHERAMRGTAYPGELMIVRRVEKMKSIELARLTHPYGAMIEELTPMRQAVALAIRQQGGVVYEPSEYKEQFKLRSTDLLMNPERKDEAMGLLMTRRRMIGMLPDDTAILERSSFVIPIYPGSSFDPELSRRMRDVPLLENKDRIRQLELAGDLQRVVPQLLESNNFEAAIPLSTTIFAYNKTTAAEIEARKKLDGHLSTRAVIMAMTQGEPNFKETDLVWIKKNYNEENLPRG